MLHMGNVTYVALQIYVVRLVCFILPIIFL